MLAVRVAFAGSDGPTLAEVEAVRAASHDAAQYPFEAVVAALGGVTEVVIALLEPAHRALALLESAGLRPTRVAVSPGGYGPGWLWRELGCPSMQEGEHRWTFMPSRGTELVVSQAPCGDLRTVDLRAPRQSLWYASRVEPWPGNRRVFGSDRRLHRLPLEPPLPQRERPPIDVETLSLSPAASAAAVRALDRMRLPPQQTRGGVLDGTRVDLHWMRDGTVHEASTCTASPDADRHSFVRAGLAIASNASSDPIRGAVAQLQTMLIRQV